MIPIKTPLFKVFMADSVTDKVNETLHSGYIAEGDKVRELTSKVSSFLNNDKAILLNSCTSALSMAYRLAGVGPETEVITTPLTCVASNVPILALGAKISWVDSDPLTGMVDPEDIEHLITEKTRAICLLHKEGDPARLDEILSIASKYHVKVIEDAAHAFGAEYKGRKVGSHGDFVCFSFQAIKHFTTGDGGALICKNEEDYLRARRLKWFGIDKDNRKAVDPWLEDIPEWGYKANMNDIAASIGLENIKHTDRLNKIFHKNGLIYSDLLNGIPGLRQVKRDLDNDYSTFWAYTVIAENRDGLSQKLSENGIASSQIHPRNDVYSMFKNFSRDLPNVDYFSDRELSIPSGWWVTEDEIHRISGIIHEGW